MQRNYRGHASSTRTPHAYLLDPKKNMRLLACAAIVALAAIILLTTCSEDTPVGPDPNVAPTALIRSPADQGDDPTEVLARPTLVVRLTDPNDPVSGLSFRWAFVSTAPFNEDWVATEDSVLSSPDSFAWSDWNAYMPTDTGMAITVIDTLDFGFYVLAVQARDPDGARSELGDNTMRRIVAVDGMNDAPVVTIHSPVSTAPDPVDISSQPTFNFEITDPDDITTHLSFRWAFVRTSPHGQDWTATEDYISTNPEDVAWSSWTAWAPDGNGTMSVTVPAPLDFAPYVLTVQAKDRNARRSDIGAENQRRVRVCDALNDIPVANILIPVRVSLNPASVPPITTIRFEASDLDNADADLSVRWALVGLLEGGLGGDWEDTIDYLRKDPDVLNEYGKTEEDSEAEWTDWMPYESNGQGFMEWTTPPVDYGGYIFAVQTRDPCDGFTEVLDEVYNVRRIRVSGRSTGPLLTVFNEFLGSVNTSTCRTPVTIADILSSIPMSFRWTANASAYGGVVVGYRYGWDIVDLDDDSQWEIDYTPFTGRTASSPPRTFFFGTHTFNVEVIDNSGYCSRVEFKLNIVLYAPARDLLLVDDFAADQSTAAGWDDPLGRGVLPDDAEHDQFWLDMLDSVDGFDPGFDVIEVAGNTPIPLSILADYKSIIWSCYSNRGQITDLPLLYQYIQYRQKDPGTTGGGGGKQQPNLLALYMAAGGHLFLNGNHPVQNNISRQFAAGSRYPFMFLYDQDGNQSSTPDVENPPGDHSFGYKELCLETVDYAISTVATRRDQDRYCSVHMLRLGDGNYNRDDGMRQALPIDPNFPAAGLRIETAGPGKAYDPAVRAFDTEVYNPQYFFASCPFVVRSRDCFEPIYALDCFDTNEPTYMQPIAFWTSAFADRVPDGGVGARSVVFGFPPVLMTPAEIKPAIEHILFVEWQLPQSP